MEGHTVFMLLSFLSLHEAQANTLQNFYRRYNGLAATTAPASLFSNRLSLPLSRSLSDSSTSSRALHDVPATNSDSIPFAPDSEAFSKIDGTPEQDEPTTSSNVDLSNDSLVITATAMQSSGSSTLAIASTYTTSAPPPWITSPEWALYSFSASQFPPPAQLATIVPNAWGGDGDSQDLPLNLNPSAMKSILSGIATAVSDAAFTTSSASLNAALTAPPTPATGISNSQLASASSLKTFGTSFSSISTDSSAGSTSTSTPMSASTPGATSAASTADSSAAPVIPPSSLIAPNSAATTPASVPPTLIASSSNQQVQATSQQQSPSKATAVSVGVTVPATALVVGFVAAFAILRHRRRSQAATNSSGRGRFDPSTDSGSTNTAHGFLGAFSKLKSNAYRLVDRSPPQSRAGNADPEKGPYDPPHIDRQATAILTKPGRLPSPSRRPQVSQPAHRVKSSQATLTDMLGNDTKDMDFHCGGDTPRGSRETIRHVSGTAEAPTAANRASSEQPEAGSPHYENFGNSPHASWLSSASDLVREPQSTVSRASVDPALPPQVRVTDDLGMALISPTGGCQWWYGARTEPDFDSYRPGVEARDFALGAYQQVRTRRASEQSSISLSSGPWSEHDEEREEFAEVPLTKGSDVQPR